MSVPVPCKEMVWGGGRWNSCKVQCDYAAKQNGYCLLHHPDQIAAREAKRKAKTNHTLALWRAQTAVHTAEAALLAAAKQYCTTCLDGEIDTYVEIEGRAYAALKTAYDTLRAAEATLAALTTETKDNG